MRSGTLDNFLKIGTMQSLFHSSSNISYSINYLPRFHSLQNTRRNGQLPTPDCPHHQEPPTHWISRLSTCLINLGTARLFVQLYLWFILYSPWCSYCFRFTKGFRCNVGKPNYPIIFLNEHHWSLTYIHRTSPHQAWPPDSIGFFHFLLKATHISDLGAPSHIFHPAFCKEAPAPI